MGTGYVRNDVGNNIADGNVINASDLDGEFDAVQAAFNGSTGHSHDGTTGEGPQIDTAGIADSAVETAKINDGAVTTDKLGADSVTGAKIGDDQIDSEHYVALSIDNEHLAADSVNGAKIADDSIDSEHYAAGSIDNEHLADDAVTGAKIDSTTTITAASFVGPLTGNVTGNVTGNADTATTLETARTIGGVSFNGSANIDLPGVNTTGNQNTTGSAATLTTARTIAGNSFDGSANITIASTDLSDSGSINAATLDSIDSTSFLRSDAADTKTSGDLSFSDNVKAIFGTGNDLEIFHDGSNSVVKELGTGKLYLGSNGTFVGIYDYANNQDMLIANTAGSVDLYYNGGEKLATTSSGVSVTGDVYATGGVGRDSGNYIGISTNSYMALNVNSGERVRVEADGDLHADGDVIAYSTTISDARLKQNVQGIENAVAKVGQLNGYTFEYIKDGKVSAGVIAQEVEAVLPEAVSEKLLPLKTDDGQEYKVVNYDALHGLLIEAIKELTARVEELEAK